jgi:hypothetical protein
MSRPTARLYLTRCYEHNVRRLVLENESGHGVRLLGTKCCARTPETTWAWNLDANELHRLSDEIGDWAGELELREMREANNA